MRSDVGSQASVQSCVRADPTAPARSDQHRRDHLREHTRHRIVLPHGLAPRDSFVPLLKLLTGADSTLALALAEVVDVSDVETTARSLLAVTWACLAPGSD